MNSKKGFTDLVEAVVAKHNSRLEEGEKRLSKKQARVILNEVFETIPELIPEEGDVFDIRGVMRFEKFMTKPRNMHNVYTGQMEVLEPRLSTKAKAKF